MPPAKLLLKAGHVGLVVVTRVLVTPVVVTRLDRHPGDAPAQR